jgi:hypothetical protein
MSATLSVHLSVEDGERARDAIHNGTLLPFLRSHESDLSCEVTEDDDDDYED